MPRRLVGGLIQCSNPINDESVPVENIKQAMFDKHVPLIDEVRSVWQFYRDRRPETYGDMVKL